MYVCMCVCLYIYIYCMCVCLYIYIYIYMLTRILYVLQACSCEILCVMHISLHATCMYSKHAHAKFVCDTSMLIVCMLGICACMHTYKHIYIHTYMLTKVHDLTTCFYFFRSYTCLIVLYTRITSTHTFRSYTCVCSVFVIIYTESYCIRLYRQ